MLDPGLLRGQPGNQISCRTSHSPFWLRLLTWLTALVRPPPTWAVPAAPLNKDKADYEVLYGERIENKPDSAHELTQPVNGNASNAQVQEAMRCYGQASLVELPG